MSITEARAQALALIALAKTLAEAIEGEYGVGAEFDEMVTRGDKNALVIRHAEAALLAALPETPTTDDSEALEAIMAEPLCYVVLEMREPEPWIEDGPFTRDEAVQIAEKHTQQMSQFGGTQYAAAAVYALDARFVMPSPPTEEQVEAAEREVTRVLSRLAKRNDWYEDDTAIGGQAAHIVHITFEAAARVGGEG